MTIFIIALVICAIAVAWWFIRAFYVTRKREDRAIQRSIEDAELRARMREQWPPKDEDTKTWSTLPPGAAA